MTATRQRVRRGLLLGAFILFPLIFYYFSPAIVQMGAAEGIVTGSALVFAAQFLGALVLGRLFCGWACSAGALGELCFAVRDRRAPGRARWTKYLVALGLIGVWSALIIRAGGVRAVDPLFMTTGGISVADAAAWIPYLAVVFVIVLMALTVSRRAFCHHICWMAPFMVVGRKLGNACRVPGLRLRADREACIHCHSCTRACPMSIDVEAMVARGNMEHADCILCSTCADVCPKDVIAVGFAAPPSASQEAHHDA